jgi:acyl-CoA reductase-like NAD-dependent aldehyde dehydrogenase
LLTSFFHFREEVFGPVAPLIPFKTEEEAVHMANDTNAGSLTISSAPII